MSHPKIIIESVDKSAQRYDTLGDWFYNKEDNLVIRVTGNVLEPEGFLIALHELVEMMLCKRRGITQQVVDTFDMDENPRFVGEPGDDPACPYRKEHRFAMLIEHLMAHELGLTAEAEGYGRVE